MVSKKHAEPISASVRARWLLAAGVLAFSCFHIVWALLVHANYSTYGFDMGIHDQAVWLMSHWKSPFVTISGNPYFGDHLSWIMFLVVPLYWVFGSAKVLLVLQPLLLGLAAIPAFLVARERLRSEWLACGLAWAYLLTPYVNWITVDRFHPDAFEVPLVFLAFWFAMRERRWSFLATIVVLMLVKEDAPLIVLGLGLWVAFRFDWKFGGLTTLLAGAWLVVNFRVVLPILSGSGSLAAYISFHGNRIPFGGVGGFLRTLGSKPWEVIKALFGPERPLYYLKVFAPMGFLPFLSPLTMAAVVLPLLFNGLSTFPYQHGIERHYGALVVSGMTVAAVFGIAHASKRVRRWLVVYMVVAAMVGLWLWGPVPGSRDQAYWPDTPKPYSAAAGAAIALIPADAVVAADCHFVTHLDHRVEIYEFPNPFAQRNWADGKSNGEPLPDRIARVQYVIVLRDQEAVLRPVFEQVLASGEFRTLYDQDGVVLLQRY